MMLTVQYLVAVQTKIAIPNRPTSISFRHAARTNLQPRSTNVLSVRNNGENISGNPRNFCDCAMTERNTQFSSLIDLLSMRHLRGQEHQPLERC